MNEKIIVGFMVPLTRMYEKPLTSNKAFIIMKLFNMKMVDGSLVTKHLNNFNTITNQLCLLGIKFDDEVRELLLLSSL